VGTYFTYFEETTVPVFREVGPEARQRLMKTSKGYQQRQTFRENLSKLGEGRLLELEPQDGESLRKLKVNIRRAANELNMNVDYGETPEGTLVVWSEAGRERRRRGPRRRSEES
jgi:hypothetical protein